ncbi:MAG: hypothetical protein ACOYVD_13215 [Bacillota bacterium]
MIDRRAVYAVKFPDDEDFQNLVMNVHIHKGNLRFLSPPDRGHEITGKLGTETEYGFTWISDHTFAGEWQFKICTIEDFRDKYYKFVFNGAAIAEVIQTTADLYEWYRKNFM